MTSEDALYNEWRSGTFSGSAWIVEVEAFHITGKLPSWAVLSLANEAPIKTEAFFQGEIFESLAGDSRPGKRIKYRETWNKAGYNVVPKAHPVRNLGGGTMELPIPRVVVTDSAERSVCVLPMSEVSDTKQVDAWSAIVDRALITKSSTTGFLFSRLESKVLSGVELDQKAAIDRLRLAEAAGLALVVSQSDSFLGVYPVNPTMLTRSEDATTLTAVEEKIDRYFAKDATRRGIFVADPVSGHDRQSALEAIRRLVQSHRQFSLSWFWFLGRSWIVISSDKNLM